MTLISPNRGYPLEKLDGNPGTMGGWSTSILDVARELEDLRTAAYATSDIAGSGSAMVAVRADGKTLAGAITPDIVLAENLARVLQAYADAFRTTAERANALIDDIEAADRLWKDRAAEAERAGLEALWSSRAEDDDAAEANADAREAVEARDSAKTALDDLWAEFEGHYSAWDEAYDAALAGLAGDGSTALTTQARDFLADLLAAGSPEEVHRLWLENPALQQELMDSHPEIIGNLDGIPYGVRAQANGNRLAAYYRETSEEPLRSQIVALMNAMRTGPPFPSLISFDPDGSEQVTAALSYGDLTNATDVNVLVPGMNSNVQGIGEWGTSARNLNAGVGPGSATIVWFGYDSPDVPEEPFMDRARDGAASLRSFLQGLDTLQPNSEIAVVAHSYGSTTAALAIGSEPGGLGVDQFIAVGSAGFPSDPDVLANLQTGPQVFATLSHDDLWARIGRDTSWGGEHGTVPETLPGVVEFDSDGGYALNPDGSYASDGQHQGEHLAGTPGHGAHGGANGMPWQGDEGNGYLMQGTESFYNVQQIIATGQPGTTTDGVGSGGGFWDLPDWLPFDPHRL